MTYERRMNACRSWGKAEQSISYKSILRRSASFLEDGSTPRTESMVDGQKLTAEESLMLQAIQEERKAFISDQKRGIAQLTQLEADGKLKKLPQPTRPPAPAKPQSQRQGQRLYVNGQKISTATFWKAFWTSVTNNCSMSYLIVFTRAY